MLLAPSNEVKIYELSLIWKEAAYNYAFWEWRKDLDWDLAYREALPRVLATESLYDYYRELMRFIALLRDSHTYVKYPSALRKSSEHMAKLPIRLVYHNDQWVVSNVARNTQIKRWSVVRKIDGIAVEDYLNTHIFPYVWHENIASADGHIWNHISNGSDGSEVIFEFEYDGEIENVTLTRMFGDENWQYKDVLTPTAPLRTLHESKTHTIAMTDDNIAIITINTFDEDMLKDELYANFSLLETARGYIIDIRHNGGGNSPNADAVSSLFIKGAYSDGRSLLPIHIGYYKVVAPFLGFDDLKYEQVLEMADLPDENWWVTAYKVANNIHYEDSDDSRDSEFFAPPGTLTAPLVVLTTHRFGGGKFAYCYEVHEPWDACWHAYERCERPTNAA